MGGSSCLKFRVKCADGLPHRCIIENACPPISCLHMEFVQGMSTCSFKIKVLLHLNLLSSAVDAHLGFLGDKT